MTRAETAPWAVAVVKTPLCKMENLKMLNEQKLAAAALAAKIARIEWLQADNHADPHPSFVRVQATQQPKEG